MLAESMPSEKKNVGQESGVDAILDDVEQRDAKNLYDIFDARIVCDRDHRARLEPSIRRVDEQIGPTTRSASRQARHRAGQRLLGGASRSGVDAPPPREAARAQIQERREERRHVTKGWLEIAPPFD